MKKELFAVNGKRFYEDMTYRCDHWRDNDYTEFTFVENDILFKHSGAREWASFIEANVPRHFIAKIKRLYDEYTTQIMEEAFINGE